MEAEDVLPRTPSYSSSPHRQQLRLQQPHLLPDEWEVEYSRFFNFPILTSPSTLNLRPLPRRKTLSGGTWITSSSLTLLRLRRPSTVPILTVSVPGIVYEEHFVSNLQVSLPLPSYAPQCLGSESRAIILSFKDCSNQVQKFALRFSTCDEVQRFLDNLKETSHDTAETGACYFERKNPTSLADSPRMVCHENPPYLRDEESNVGKSASALTFNDMAVESSQLQSLSNASAAISPTLPPSFSDFLLNCSGNKHDEQSKVPVSFTCNTELSIIESIANASVSETINKLAHPISEMAGNAQLMKYASSASFQDMLANIEGIIQELGDDMSL